jgi:hypothetical protein
VVCLLPLLRPLAKRGGEIALRWRRSRSTRPREDLGPRNGLRRRFVEVMQRYGVQGQSGVFRMLLPPRHPRQQLGDAVQVTAETVIRQPIELGQLQGRLGHFAMRPLHVLGMFDKLSLLALPIALFFLQLAIVRQQLQFAHVMIAQVERQMGHQVVVVDKAVVGQPIGAAELAVAGPWRTVGIDRADRIVVGGQPMGDQRGHRSAEAVAGNPDSHVARESAQ